MQRTKQNLLLVKNALTYGKIMLKHFTEIKLKCLVKY